MEILSYTAFIFMGIILGLIGGGGSILTVPILVYLFGTETVAATSYSLFIVGVTAMVGSFKYFTDKLVDLKAAVAFSIPSLLAVFAVRKIIIPIIPDEFFTIFGINITKSIFILLVFAVLMLLASFSMLRKSTIDKKYENTGFNYPLIFVEGILVGAITGFVGAGGGFLIIPALVLLAKIPMKVAIGTSLVIIAAKSLLGFLGDVTNDLSIDWISLSMYSILSVTGIFIGSKLSGKLSQERLKKVFAYFVLVMGIFIIMKELFFK